MLSRTYLDLMASLEDCKLYIGTFRLKQYRHSPNLRFQNKLFKDVSHQVMFISVFIFCFIWISSAQMVCQEGIKSFTGITYPRGDIILKQGDTLDVYCTVNLTHPLAVGYNANNLVFEINKHEIPEYLIDKKIINETTIRMRVEKMNASTIHLLCTLQKDDGKTAPVCQNHVEVGFPPLKPEDLHCVAWNWTKLVCTWRKPHNPVATKYNVSFVTYVRNLMYETPCRTLLNYKNKTASCEWNKHDPYKPNMKMYTIKFNGTNALNKTGVVWMFQVDHYSIVVPEPPEKFNVTPIQPNKLLVSYSFKYFEHFPPGLDHEITVCTEGNTCDKITFSTKMTEFFVSREIDVPYAYTTYHVAVRIKSSTANNTDEFWSIPVFGSAQTMEQIPDSPPKTDIGSYEVNHYNLQRRDIYVYWEQISPFYQNGPDFRYETVIYENENKRDDVKPVEINFSFAKYINLSVNAAYEVEVYSANQVGRSKEKSVVIIPSSQEAPKEPRKVSKADYANGTYEVRWTRPVEHANIVSYTVFRCNHRRHQCNGIMKWDVVPVVGDNDELTKSTVYQNLSRGNEEVYQFAVSANSHNMSSGLVWATCSVNLDKVLESLKNVRVANYTDDVIHVEWELECSYDPGVIRGFKIVYCQVDEGDKCTSSTAKSVSFTPDKNMYTLKNLQPDTKYMIAISVQTNAGESEQSRPIYQKTNQAGGHGWRTWTIVTVAVIFGLGGVILGAVKCWHCCKEMNDFEVKLPPGLQKELNPFNQVHRKRKNSVEDVQPYGKETMSTYPLKYTPSSNNDEEQGILPSAKNNKERNLTDGNADGDDKKTVVHQSMDTYGGTSDQETRFENEITDVPWWKNVESDPKTVKIANCNGIPALLPDQNNCAEDCLIDAMGTGTSPSVLNPLLSDRAFIDQEEDSLQPEGTHDAIRSGGDHYTKLGMFPNSNGNVVGVLLDDSSEPVGFPVQTPPGNDYSNTMESDNLYNQSPSSSSSMSPNSPEKVTTTASRIVPDVLTNNASYVKWTQFLPEFNGVKNESINPTTRQSPYCQVGII